ncbi:hypothetical protein Tco_0197023, partial [Tanacetum coccineum]
MHEVLDSVIIHLEIFVGISTKKVNDVGIVSLGHFYSFLEEDHEGHNSEVEGSDENSSYDFYFDRRIKFSITKLDKVGTKAKSMAGPKFRVELLFGPDNPNDGE